MSHEPDPDADPDRRPDDLLDSLARRASEEPAGAAEDAEEELDLVEALREPGEDAGAGDDTGTGEEADEAAAARPADEPESERSADEPPPDLTLIGYVERHDRPPAFTGVDDQPYTVDVDVQPTGDPEEPYAAFLVFVRWAATGAGIMGHVESGDVAYGATEDEARMAGLELSLYDIKAELDEAIRRRRKALEE